MGMRRGLFALAWTFILLAALYDVLFAWQYRDVFDAWEMNPFVRWTAHRFGLHVVFGFKATSLAFATALAGYCHFHRLRIELPYTVIVCALYLLLSLHYVREQLTQPMILHRAFPSTRSPGGSWYMKKGSILSSCRSG
jgi:hypothetical protein